MRLKIYFLIALTMLFGENSEQLQNKLENSGNRRWHSKTNNQDVTEKSATNEYNWKLQLEQGGTENDSHEDSSELYKNLDLRIDPRSTNGLSVNDKHLNRREKLLQSEKEAEDETPEDKTPEIWRWYLKRDPEDILKADKSSPNEDVVSWYLNKKGKDLPQNKIDGKITESYNAANIVRTSIDSDELTSAIPVENSFDISALSNLINALEVFKQTHAVDPSTSNNTSSNVADIFDKQLNVTGISTEKLFNVNQDQSSKNNKSVLSSSPRRRGLLTFPSEVNNTNNIYDFQKNSNKTVTNSMLNIEINKPLLNTNDSTESISVLPHNRQKKESHVVPSTILKSNIVLTSEKTFPIINTTGSQVDNVKTTINTPVNEIELDQDSLVLVNVLFRHGNRTLGPDAETYPKDPYYNFDYYPIGRGELTLTGKQTMFKLGQQLRQIYGKFLGDTYHPQIVDSISTGLNRTKMSLELVLAGLFPPRKQDMIASSLPGWQPISYKYLDIDKDTMFNAGACLNYATEDSKATSIPIFQSSLKKYRHVFDYVSRNTGRNITKLSDIWLLNLGLQMENEFGMKLPKWTKSVYPDIFNAISLLQFRLNVATNELKRIFVGAFLRKLTTDSRVKLSSHENKFVRKLYLYSVHDVNIAAILMCLGVFDDKLPNYGAHIIIELHLKNNVPGFKIFYNNFHANRLKLLKLPGCSTFCPLNSFIDLVSEILPIHGDTDCILK